MNIKFRALESLKAGDEVHAAHHTLQLPLYSLHGNKSAALIDIRQRVTIMAMNFIQLNIGTNYLYITLEFSWLIITIKL